MGELAFHGGMWRWGAAPDSPAVRLASLIKSRGAALDTLQMETLRRMVRPLCEPHAVITQLLAAATHQVRLTPRESEVLDLLCTGLSAAVISRRLGLSPRTVTKHQERLYRKLGTSDRLNTVLRAKALGIA
ncbi:MAG TPA: helix-turn-helix transcriptional regulator [Pseudonocardiaceae bacterium]|nr:helix-turn-helix transcriptional regulator [Pseudonocardiaceae bacterium]